MLAPNLRKTHEAGGGAHHVALTPDERLAYVQNSLLNLPGMSDGTITVVDLEKEEVLGTLDTFSKQGLNPNMIVLLPDWAPFNIYEMSAWSRTIIVPLSLLWAFQPVTRLSSEHRIDERGAVLQLRRVEGRDAAVLADVAIRGARALADPVVAIGTRRSAQAVQLHREFAPQRRVTRRRGERLPGLGQRGALVPERGRIALAQQVQAELEIARRHGRARVRRRGGL